MKMLYLKISTMLVAAAGCSLCKDDVVSFCADDGLAKLSLDKKNARYKYSLTGEPAESSHGDIEDCSDSSYFCIKGPFYIKLRKEFLKKKMDTEDVFNFFLLKKKVRYDYIYEKMHGLKSISFTYNYDGEEGAPPLFYSKCPFEKDDYRFSLM